MARTEYANQTGGRGNQVQEEKKYDGVVWDHNRYADFVVFAKKLKKVLVYRMLRKSGGRLGLTGVPLTSIMHSQILSDITEIFTNCYQCASGA